jgi:lysocardiolipin and lysophospholipid acyltransferase
LKPIIGRKRFRQVCDFVQHAWFDAAFSLISRTKMHVYGQIKNLHVHDDDKRPRIVIANHATDMDWAYIWMIAHACDTPRSGHVKVMLKEGIRKVPLFGWLLDNLDFLWMKRNWESDRSSIQATIEKLCSDNEHLWLVIFPEGMTINTKSLEKSHEFATIENRPHLDMTLLPRDKGLAAVLDYTKHLNPEIVDITMAFESFSGEIPTWEMGYERNVDHLVPNAKKLMAGMAGDVFIDIQTFSIEDIAQHPDGLRGWLDDRWIRKDHFLKHFAKHEEFPLDNAQKEIKMVQGSFGRLAFIAFCDVLVLKAAKEAASMGWRTFMDVRK